MKPRKQFRSKKAEQLSSSLMGWYTKTHSSTKWDFDIHKGQMTSQVTLVDFIRDKLTIIVLDYMDDILWTPILWECVINYNAIHCDNNFFNKLDEILESIPEHMLKNEAIVTEGL